MARLADRGTSDGVIQIQTPFGGGKTHALIALYHLFAGGVQLANLDPVIHVLQEAAVDRVPLARLATFVGTAADPLGRTPWDDLAQQLGCYDLLREHDQQRRAPGKELLHQLLGEQPTLILMDEIAEYVVKARGFDAQVLAFFHELTDTVRVQPRCALVVTLPSSAPYGEEGERALHQLQQIFGRVEAIYTPVEGAEIYRSSVAACWRIPAIQPRRSAQPRATLRCTRSLATMFPLRRASQRTARSWLRRTHSIPS